MTFANNAGDVESRLLWRLMFPNSDRYPASSFKELVYADIALLVSNDLGGPVCGVGGYLVVMRWATMPKASVNEHGDLRGTEDKVSRSPNVRQRPGADSVPEAKCMDCRTERQLGFSVPTAVALHDSSNRWCGCPRFV